MRERCEHAYKCDRDDTVRCKLMRPPNDCCGFVKFCRMTGHWENNDSFPHCVIRKNQRLQSLKGENKNGNQV